MAACLVSSLLFRICRSQIHRLLIWRLQHRYIWLACYSGDWKFEPKCTINLVKNQNFVYLWKAKFSAILISIKCFLVFFKDRIIFVHKLSNKPHMEKKCACTWQTLLHWSCCNIYEKWNCNIIYYCWEKLWDNIWNIYFIKIRSIFVLWGAYLPSKVVTWGPFTDLHRAGLSISSTMIYKDWKTESVINLT